MTHEERDFRPRPVSHLVVQCLDDELLIYDTKEDKAHCLNPGMWAVWEQCDGESSLLEILDKLQKKNDRRLTIDHVRLAIKQLLNAQLLEVTPSNTILNGLSRRQIMRKMGKGALVALPVIASVAIPTPAEAASCFGLLHVCSSSSQCCSGHCGVSGIKLLCLP
jgi:hypothetical protein